MRNCALNVIGEVLKNLYTGRPHLEGKDKIQRDRLMDVLQVAYLSLLYSKILCFTWIMRSFALQEHIHDVNGFVRARALQIWYNIASAGVSLRCLNRQF